MPKIDDFSSLATILEQSLFFGGSLGRVGVDFRAILVVYFEDHVLELMGTQWRTASREFHDSLSAHALPSSAANGTPISSSYSKTPIVIASYRSAASADGSSNGISPFASRAATGEDYSPPHALMAFPILAEFTNALLMSLNELRLCTIASLQTRLAKKLQSTICSVILAIAEFCEDNKLRINELPSSVNSNGQQNGNGDANPSSKKQMLTEALQSTVEVRTPSFIAVVVCGSGEERHPSLTLVYLYFRSCARNSFRT